MNVGELRDRLELSDPDTPFAMQIRFPSGRKSAPTDPDEFGCDVRPPGETLMFIFGVGIDLLDSACDWNHQAHIRNDDLLTGDLYWRTRDEFAPFLEAMLERLSRS